MNHFEIPVMVRSSPCKTQISSRLNVVFCVNELTCDNHIQYLSFDPESLFQTRTTPDVSKMEARNNSAESEAEVSFPSLRVVTAMTLIFSAAQYTTEVWVGNMYTECINTHLPTGTKIVLGTLKVAPNVWLSIFIHNTIISV